MVPLLILLLSLASTALGSGEHASTYASKYRQLVMSSTLRWRPYSNLEMTMSIPKEAVPSGTGNPSRIVCRAEPKKHAMVLVGQTVTGGYCAVGFGTQSFK